MKRKAIFQYLLSLSLLFLIPLTSQAYQIDINRLKWVDTIYKPIIPVIHNITRLKCKEVKGRWYNTSAFDIKDDNSYEYTKAFRNIIWLNADYTSNINGTSTSNIIFLRASGRFNRIDEFNSDNHQRSINLEIWDSYISLTEPNWDILIGKKIVRWGKTDQISPVDNVNPQDFRSFVLLKREDRKEPVFMIRTRLFLGANTLEFILDPQARHNRLYYFDSDWAVFDHIKEEYKNLPYIGQVIENLHIKKPSNGPALKNSEVGIRLSGDLSNFDYGISILWAHNRSLYPYIKSFPIKGIYVDNLDNITFNPYTNKVVGNDIVIEYPRDTIFGLSLETTAGPYGIRGEWAWHTHYVLMQKDLTSVKKHCLVYVLGIDRTWNNNIYTNLEFIQQWIPRWDNNILFERRLDSGILFRISDTFLRDTFKIKLQGSYSFTTRDYYLNPEFSYKPEDNLRLFTGLHIIGGPVDTLFHQYDKNDEIYIGFEAFF